MSDLGYTPTFLHTDWIDNVDRIEAGGPRGLNARLHGIENDLNRITPLIDQIDIAIDQIRVTGRRIALPPPFLATRPTGTSWFMNSDGVMITSVSSTTPAASVACVAPPDQSRLTAFRIRGVLTPTGQGAVNLNLQVIFSRLPFQLTPSPPVLDTLASTAVTAAGAFDVTMQIAPQKAAVDLDAFRYVVSATFSATANALATFECIEFDFLSAA